MSPRQLMRLWEIRHGKLSAAQQEDFLAVALDYDERFEIIHSFLEDFSDT